MQIKNPFMYFEMTVLLEITTKEFDYLKCWESLSGAFVFTRACKDTCKIKLLSKIEYFNKLNKKCKLRPDGQWNVASCRFKDNLYEKR